MTNEIHFYIEQLRERRQSVRDLLLGLTEEGLNWRPLAEGTNSIYALAKHAAWVEEWWIGTVIGQHPRGRAWEGDEDLEGHGEDAADLLFWLDEAATISEQVLSALDPPALDEERSVPRRDRSQSVSCRWAIVHTVEHYAEHVGQMRLTRQLWEAHAT